MNLFRNRSGVVRAIVWLYPKAWRERYSDEFVTLLSEQKLTVLVVFDVVRAACRERIASGLLAQTLATLMLSLGPFLAMFYLMPSASQGRLILWDPSWDPLFALIYYLFVSPYLLLQLWLVPVAVAVVGAMAIRRLPMSQRHPRSGAALCAVNCALVGHAALMGYAMLPFRGVTIDGSRFVSLLVLSARPGWWVALLWGGFAAMGLIAYRFIGRRNDDWRESRVQS